MQDDYLALEKAWKKIHQSNIKEEKYVHWALSRVAYPSGSDVSHNYVTRTVLKGEKQLAAYLENSIFPADIESVLTAAERELVSRTGDIRKLIRSEVYARADYILPEDMAMPKVSVFNYFSFPPTGSRSAHLQVERDIWMPVHQARIAAEELNGWVLLTKRLPFGSGAPYQDATVDLYDDMEEYLRVYNPTPFMAKAHPGQDMETLFAATDAAATLISGEVRVWVDDARH